MTKPGVNPALRLVQTGRGVKFPVWRKLGAFGISARPAAEGAGRAADAGGTYLFDLYIDMQVF